MTESTDSAEQEQTTARTGGRRLKDALAVLDTPASASTANRIKAVRVRTTIIFVLVLVGLYVVAQAHTPRALVLCAFVVYVVAAVLWLRAQYVDAIDGSPTEIWRWLVWLVTGLGAGTLVTGWLLTKLDAPPVRPGALIIPGVLAVYLGIGHLIARSRALVGMPGTARQPDGPVSRLVLRLRRLGISFRNSHQALLWTSIGLVAALFAGLVLLDDVPTTWCVVLMAPSVLVPWFVNLLSEHAINHLADGGQAGVRTTAMLVAGALTVVAVIVVGVVWGLLPAVLASVMVAFAVALASFTMADIAAVLAIVAFMGVTPQQDATDRPLEAAGKDDQVLVVLGDSYMSGEGAATFIEGTDEGGGNECRRSTTSWSMIAGHQPPFDKVVSFACSGADSPNIRRAPEEGATKVEALKAGFLEPVPFPQFEGGKTQLEEYDAWASTMPADFAPDLVVLSVGGNDAGFSSIGLTCVVPGSCNAAEPQALWADGNMDRLENRLRQVYTEVADTFPETPVVVIPYPDPVHDSAVDEKCSTAMLQTGDAIFVKGFLRSLNTRILETTVDFGFHYAHPMAGAMERRGLQLCDDSNGGRAGVNFIGIRSVGGLSEQRFNPTKWHHNSLHPNERGHAALHEAFQRWLTSMGGLPGLHVPTSEEDRADAAEVDPSKAARSEPADGSGDCATFPDGDEQGCRAQSNAWAIGQAGLFAAWSGALGIGIGVLAWITAVAFFAWRRGKARA